MGKSIWLVEANTTVQAVMVKKQLTEAGKGRALGLLEDAGWSVKDVANKMGVSRWTIMRLVKKKKEDPKSEVPRRKKGTGAKKKYGQRELDAIENALERNSFLTSTDLKIMMPKLLRNLDARTIRRIMRDELDRPASVAPVKAVLTDEMRSERIKWVKGKLKLRKAIWEDVLFCDEVMFQARGGGGDWRLVRRPRTAPRFAPKYCRRRYKRPRKLMALAGIAADGSRFLEFLKTGQMMKSVTYCKSLKKKALPLVKPRNLMILHDGAKIHSSRYTQNFLTQEKVKSLMLPGNSFDLNPLENCFGLLKRKLVKEPTRSIKEMKRKVRLLWRRMTNDYLFKLCTSMRRRLLAVQKAEGYMTKY